MLLRTLVAGAIAGAVFLGVSTRLAMRGVANILALPGLTPRRLSTFLLFVPWFVGYGVTMSLIETRPGKERG